MAHSGFGFDCKWFRVDVSLAKRAKYCGLRRQDAELQLFAGGKLSPFRIFKEANIFFLHLYFLFTFLSLDGCLK